MIDVRGLSGFVEGLERFFVEPAEPSVVARSEPRPEKWAPSGDLEIGVLGLSSGCGSSTVATGLALELAERAYDAHLVQVGSDASRAHHPIGPVSVWSLPPALTGSTEVAEYGGVVNRLAGSYEEHDAPTLIVWDVSADQAERANEALSKLAAVVAVADGASDPFLSERIASILSDRFNRVLLAVNGAEDGSEWQGRAVACLPRSRRAARMICQGRMPSGAFSWALQDLLVALERS